MAADVSADVQWYQSDRDVTVSFKLPLNTDKTAVRARFDKEQCVVFEAESNQVIWQAYLCYPVIPEQCKVRPAGKRIEVRLRKAFSQHWSDLCNNSQEVTISSDTPMATKSPPPPPPSPPSPPSLPLVTNSNEDNEVETDEEMFHTPPAISPTHNSPSHNTSSHNLPSHNTYLHNSPSHNTYSHNTPSHNTHSHNAYSHNGHSHNALSHDSLSSSHDSLQQSRDNNHVTFKAFGDVEDNTSFDLKHIQHDLVEKDNNSTVSVKLYVPQVIPQSCLTTFNKSTVIVQFKTFNNQFLHLYPGSSSLTQFTWNIKLFDNIIPDQSSSSVKEKYIELFLIKAQPQCRWRSLERPVINRKSISSLDNNLTTSNDLNNLDVDKEDEKRRSVKSVGKTAMNFEFNPFMLSKKPTSPPPPSHSTSLPLAKPVSSSLCQNTPPNVGESLKSSEHKRTGSSNKDTPPAQITPPNNDLQTNSEQKEEATTSIKSFFRLPSYQFQGPSQTGISNMGNSCFMSSILQTLSNTVEVRDYFLGERYKKELNLTNPLGCNGQLAECFSTVIDELWSGEKRYISVKGIKDLIASKREQFSGYSQQDAHEFIMFFLDGLHEDLNRILNKPLTPQVESNGRPDNVVSEESWINYKRRNDSFFVDLFGGQFKSTLVCPECSKESVTFDPFMSLSVPIPQKSQTLSVIFFSKDPSIHPKEIVVSLAPEVTLEILRASVATKLNISMRYLRMIEVGPKCSLAVNNTKKISEIPDKNTIVMCEVVSYHEAKEKVEEVYVVQRLQYPPLSSKCSRKECSKREEDLKRCGRCRSVGYCSKECQEKDWSVHRHQCKVSCKTLIGLPFVISLPITGMTYDNIVQKAQQYASWSVNFERQTSDCSSSSLFDLISVDEYGKTLSGANSTLVNKGKDTLTLSGKYLAMDWKNKPNQTNVTVKDLAMYQTAGKKSGIRENRDIKLEDCLQLFTEPETLPKDNAWYCPACKEHREATKCLCVSRLPPVLIIHLKRFSFNDYTQRNKIDKFVDFPLKGLDMGPFLHSDNSSSPPLYDLYATVNHYGAVFLGHYIAMIKSPVGSSSEWFCCDDENVTRMPTGKVKDRSAYLLFYRRRDLS